MVRFDGYGLGGLDWVRRTGVQEWFWQEQKDLAGIKWKFLEKRGAADTASDLAGYMQLFPAEDVVAWPYVYEDWDPSQVRGYVLGAALHGKM